MALKGRCLSPPRCKMSTDESNVVGNPSRGRSTSGCFVLSRNWREVLSWWPSWLTFRLKFKLIVKFIYLFLFSSLYSLQGSVCHAYCHKATQGHWCVFYYRNDWGIFFYFNFPFIHVKCLKNISVNIKPRMPKPKTFTVCKSLANLWEGAHSPPPPSPSTCILGR